ncbi:MAG: hypothetical protein DDT20_00774 [Firmicutes bacterium]|nr:hypothetical protein [Bacillota bacterium]
MTALQVGAIQRCGIGEVLLRPLSEQSTWLTYELLLEGRIAELAWTEPLVTAALVEVSLEREAASPHFAQPTHVLLTLTVKDGVLSTAYGEMLARLRGVLADRYDLSPAAITMQVR